MSNRFCLFKKMLNVLTNHLLDTNLKVQGPFFNNKLSILH